MKIRIDADTHFTPFDAYDEVSPQFREIGPHYAKLDNGCFRMTCEASPPVRSRSSLTLKECVENFSFGA